MNGDRAELLYGGLTDQQLKQIEGRYREMDDVLKLVEAIRYQRGVLKILRGSCNHLRQTVTELRHRQKLDAMVFDTSRPN